ncbi:MAG: NfeD family protein [Bacilli bacterium]
MFYLWLGIVILLVIVELLTVKLTTIWYAISGLVALVLALVMDNFIIEFLVFIVLGTMLMLTTKSKFEEWLNVRKVSESLDIGMSAVVTREICKNKPGEVEIDGQKLMATASKKIRAGSIVSIKKINGMEIDVAEDQK